jgi:hypothetical protein
LFAAFCFLGCSRRRAGVAVLPTAGGGALSHAYHLPHQVLAAQDIISFHKFKESRGDGIDMEYVHNLFDTMLKTPFDTAEEKEDASVGVGMGGGGGGGGGAAAADADEGEVGHDEE